MIRPPRLRRRDHARAAYLTLVLVIASLAPCATALAQTRDAAAAGWERRAGEGAFSLRNPLSGLYLLVGGHAGFAAETQLEDDKGCQRRRAFFLGCENAPPTDSLGVGGGGSVGIGTRLAPALRTALIATGEAGYHFDDRWVDRAGRSFDERFSLHSYQLTANAYLDGAGLVEPGMLRRFNPYVMAGLGFAVNVTGETRETFSVPGVATVLDTYPGSTRGSFLWTAGAGLQYRLANGIVADFSYQYVDAGRFRAAEGGPQIDGFTGLPFPSQFDPIRGHFRTHRLGVAINIELESIFGPR